MHETLTAQWQGLYQIVRAVGRVNYLVNMHDKQNLNMLKKWHVPTSTGYFAQDIEEQESEDEVPTSELCVTQTNLRHTSYIHDHVPITLSTHFHAVNC